MCYNLDGDDMKFNEILNICNDNFDVILGFNENEILTINIKDKPSIIITGSTGTSKSILMHEILLQLINKNSYNDLKIIPIAPTRVELIPYTSTKYSYFDVVSEKEESLETLNKINSLIEERKKLFLKNDVTNFDSYNKINKENKLPFIIVAIDEATDILKYEMSSNILFKLIDNCLNSGIAIVLNTNNVYNEFFEENINTLANVKISFDFVTSSEDKLVNLNNVHNLELGKFIIKIGNERKQSEYQVINFDDKYINEILEKI